MFWGTRVADPPEPVEEQRTDLLQVLRDNLFVVVLMVVFTIGGAIAGVVFLTDEPAQSLQVTPADLVQVLHAHDTGRNSVSAHGIVRLKGQLGMGLAAERYREVIDDVGGVVGDIADPDFGALMTDMVPWFAASRVISMAQLPGANTTVELEHDGVTTDLVEGVDFVFDGQDIVLLADTLTIGDVVTVTH